mmetsp:Transcript_9608/g.25108  ORF Transcript_9608/g.25108 Transcript_9608/m.25108 type:complete len:201 (-) Transcript_9608:577-1179(-)
MACGRQCTCPDGCLVQRHGKPFGVRGLVLDRYHVYDRCADEHDAEFLNINRPFRVIPSRAIHEYSMDVDAQLRRVLHILGVRGVLDLELERQLVHWDLVLAGIALQHRGQESLREVERRYPKCGRFPAFDPIAEELHPLDHVVVPRAQGLQAGVANVFRPNHRDLVVDLCLEHVVEVLRHDDGALDGLLLFLQRLQDLLE